MDDDGFEFISSGDENCADEEDFKATDSNSNSIRGNSASDIRNKEQKPATSDPIEAKRDGPAIADSDYSKKAEQDFEASEELKSEPVSHVLVYKENPKKRSDQAEFTADISCSKIIEEHINPKKRSDQAEFTADASCSKIIEEHINPKFDAQVSEHGNFAKRNDDFPMRNQNKIENDSLNVLAEGTNRAVRGGNVLSESSFDSIADRSLREGSKKLNDLIPATCDNCHVKPSQKAMLVSSKLKVYCVDCSRLTVAKRRKEAKRTGREVPWQCILIVEGVTALAAAAMESGIEISQSLRN